MRLLITLALIFTLYGAFPSFAEENGILARVVGVHDGDTITVLTSEKKSLKIRLAEIDTPETGQPYGTKSKQILSDLVFGKEVKIKVYTIDRYGRIVGRVFQGEFDINAELVRTGSAWVYRRYSRDKSLLILEQSARDMKRGLWGLSETERTPPWEWRKREKNINSRNLQK